MSRSSAYAIGEHLKYEHKRRYSGTSKTEVAKEHGKLHGFVTKRKDHEGKTYDHMQPVYNHRHKAPKRKAEE